MHAHGFWVPKGTHGPEIILWPQPATPPTNNYLEAFLCKAMSSISRSGTTKQRTRVQLKSS